MYSGGFFFDYDNEKDKMWWFKFITSFHLYSIDFLNKLLYSYSKLNIPLDIPPGIYLLEIPIGNKERSIFKISKRVNYNLYYSLVASI